MRELEPRLGSRRAAVPRQYLKEDSVVPNIGVPELLIILAIVMLIFGYSRLPQLGRGLGEAISNFRKGLKGNDEPTPDDSTPSS